MRYKAENSREEASEAAGAMLNAKNGLILDWVRVRFRARGRVRVKVGLG